MPRPDPSGSLTHDWQYLQQFVSEYEALRYNFELLSLHWMPLRTGFAGTGWGMSRRQIRQG
jgi:hypothetical protein